MISRRKYRYLVGDIAIQVYMPYYHNNVIEDNMQPV